MTKAEAIQAFFSQFLPAYEENSVYNMEEPPSFPYLTYQLFTGAFDPEGTGIQISISLWYYDESLDEINTKTEEISQRIGRHGIRLKCDGGCIVIRRIDSNFAQTLADPTNDYIKRKYINLKIEFYTND